MIVKELKAVADKYGKERRTALVYDHEIEADEEPDVPDYPVTVFVSREGYFKKITPQSLRMASEQKFKEGDGLLFLAGDEQQSGAAGVHGPVSGLQMPPVRL